MNSATYSVTKFMAIITAVLIVFIMFYLWNEHDAKSYQKYCENTGQCVSPTYPGKVQK